MRTLEHLGSAFLDFWFDDVFRVCLVVFSGNDCCSKYPVRDQ